MSHLIWGWRGSGSPYLPQQQDCQASNWHHLISLRGPISLGPPNPCQHMHLPIERREMQSGTPLLKACWSLRWWPNRWFYFVPSHAAYIFSSALHVPPLCIFFFFPWSLVYIIHCQAEFSSGDWEDSYVHSFKWMSRSAQEPCLWITMSVTGKS